MSCFRFGILAPPANIPYVIFSLWYLGHPNKHLDMYLSHLPKTLLHPIGYLDVYCVHISCLQSVPRNLMSFH
jgi:hypothetical protein